MSEAAMTSEMARTEKRRRLIGKIKWAIYRKAYAIFWRTLHFTKLAWPYSRMMCRLNLYRRFPDGRCQWCANNHYPERQQGDE